MSPLISERVSVPIYVANVNLANTYRVDFVWTVRHPSRHVYR